jgi:hypothetical protein
MSPAVIGTAVVVLIVAAVLGWHGQKTYAAHGDVKVAKTRLSGGRKTRLRSGIWVLVLIVVILLIFKDVGRL